MDSYSSRHNNNVSNLRGVRVIYKGREVPHTVTNDMEINIVANLDRSNTPGVHDEAPASDPVRVPRVVDHPPKLWGMRPGTVLGFIAGINFAFIIQWGLATLSN